jgi:hypothetical protein
LIEVVLDGADHELGETAGSGSDTHPDKTNPKTTITQAKRVGIGDSTNYTL